jgi:hypothetical protein
MAEMRPCKHCRKRFRLRPQSPSQEYCSAPACQRARKRNWQRQKNLSDPAYRGNRQDAQRRWREKNPGYWREYRKRNPEYTLANRARQQARNSRRKRPGAPGEGGALIAKTDASEPDKFIKSGIYLLTMAGAAGIAKMDALTVEINVISTG